jgi:type VI secretion system protein ImpM
MPEPLTTPDPAALRAVAAIGFCGKLPARGDFVSAGLPRRFVDPWHDWMQRMLAASREALAEAWLEVWLEAPVWRFTLSPGVCGPDGVLGLWMPSVDRVGRYFPLTFAALARNFDLAGPACGSDGFLAVAEAAGRDALASDLAPDDVVARLGDAAANIWKAGADPAACPPGGSLWWSDGSARVPRTTTACASLPDEAEFVSMLDAGASEASSGCGDR